MLMYDAQVSGFNFFTTIYEQISKTSFAFNHPQFEKKTFFQL